MDTQQPYVGEAIAAPVNDDWMEYERQRGEIEREHNLRATALGYAIQASSYPREGYATDKDITRTAKAFYDFLSGGRA